MGMRPKRKQVVAGAVSVADDGHPCSSGLVSAECSLKPNPSSSGSRSLRWVLALWMLSLMPTATLITTLNDCADLVLKLLWPTLLIILVWRLFPSIRGIVEARGFHLKLWGAEVTVQDASNQLSKQIDNLNNQVLELRARLGPTDGAQEARRAPPAPGVGALPAPSLRRALWVDDRAENNAYEKAKLGELGIQVAEARTTAEALLLLGDGSYDVVITDVSRVENGSASPNAGLELLRGLPPGVPAYIYSSTGAVQRMRDAVLRAGAWAATASPTELIELVSGSPMGAAIALDQRVAQYLGDAHVPVVGQPGGTPDFVITTPDGRVGIESRAWGGPALPPIRRIEQVIDRLELAVTEERLARVFIVTPSGFSLPEPVAGPPWLSIVSLEVFREWLKQSIRDPGEHA